MRVEPTLDKIALFEMIHREYGLSVERLRFLPTGWTAYCYAADCADGERYFLKLTGDSDLVPFAASDRDFYLPMTHQLRAKQLLPNVACPIRTRSGQFTARFQNYLLILFHFIEGEVVGHDGMSEDVLAILARMIGILHRSTPEIAVEKPFVEEFDINFESSLIDGLDALETTTPDDARGRRELCELLLPRKDELLDRLDRLKELQASARATEKQMVVCHTDLHGENLMIDERGNLHIIDWEGAMIAPPEHDLFFFAGYDYFWDLFLPNYERKFGPVSLDSAVFGFYYYRRTLEDLVDWIVRILYHNTSYEQDREDLEGIVEDCIAGWPYLEPTIKGIEQKLIRRDSDG